MGQNGCKMENSRWYKQVGRRSVELQNQFLTLENENMAYFKLNTFGGKAPRISPRLLADSLAQTATDVNLESGRLVPIKDNSTTNPSAGYLLLQAQANKLFLNTLTALNVGYNLTKM